MQTTNSYPPPRVAWLTVAILCLAYVSSFVDRMIMSLLVEPIKRDLAISDTEMGLLLGLSFTIFYTFLGLPIGWLADRKNRKNIIAIGVTVWSIMTAICGLAGNYLQLFIARMGVGVGEAALTPPAYSIITDSFPKRKLATAISVYAIGVYIGSGLAFLIGGWLVDIVSDQTKWNIPLIGAVFPWQLVFFYVGLPGLIIAALIYFFIQEPTRKDVQSNMQQQTIGASLKLYFSYFQKHARFFISHHLGYAFFVMMTYSVSLWIPSHLKRNFGIETLEIGLKYGIIIAIFGTLGVIAGGKIADWLSGKGYADAKIRMGIVAILAVLPFASTLFWISSANAVFLLLIPITFFSSFPLGAGSASLQEAVPNEMRGLSSAVYVFITNLIGLGLGPLLVGVVTDYVFTDEKLVGLSLVVVAAFALIISLSTLLLAMQPYRTLLKAR
ncbi:MAG: spinster family MFS transporter [Flammeovirgaceae bacterium]